jgi:hypothetical protein
MFKRLRENCNIDLPESLIEEVPYVFYGRDAPSGFVGLRYFRLKDTTEQIEATKEAVLGPLITDFTMSVLKINVPIVPPHIDSFIRTSVNLYISTSGQQTIFYDPLPEKAGRGAQRGFQVEGQGRTYTFADVQQVGSFTARDNEVWALDVSKIHSVVGTNMDHRTALVFQTKIPFDEVVRQIEQLGCVRETALPTVSKTAGP